MGAGEPERACVRHPVPPRPACPGGVQLPVQPAFNQLRDPSGIRNGPAVRVLLRCLVVARLRGLPSGNGAVVNGSNATIALWPCYGVVVNGCNATIALCP